jgi:hypothetical protein
MEQVTDALPLFINDVGEGEFYFRAFLHSEGGAEAVELDSTTIVFDPTIQFDGTESSGDESVTNVLLPLTLSKALPVDATVDYSVTGGSAESGSDYVLEAGTLTIPAGELTTTIPLVLVDNNGYEPDETVVVTLSSPNNILLGDYPTHTYTILNDDKPAGGKQITSVSGMNLSLNLGEECTKISTIELSIAAEGAVSMVIGNDPNFLDASWESYAPMKEWELPPGDGEHTVYTMFRSSSMTLSPVVSDTILLDTKTACGKTPTSGILEIPKEREKAESPNDLEKAGWLKEAISEFWGIVRKN